MLDAWWWDAHQALLRHLPEGAKVLLPDGDWPNLPFQTTFYRGTDCNIAIDGYDAVLINKGMLASFRQADIRTCLKDLATVSANKVFVLFVQRPRQRVLMLPFHLYPLKIYVDPARYRRRGMRRCAFIHIPKTAGTSIWAKISKAVHSNVYFSSNTTLAAFEGDLDAFEAVGGHIQAETLATKGWRDPVFFVLRDPVERVLSFIAHAQRIGENLSRFDTSFHEARQIAAGSFDEKVRDLLFHEGNMQVRTLGERPGETLQDAAILSSMRARAFERLECTNWSFGLVEHPQYLARQVAAHFGTSGGDLRHFNRTRPIERPDCSEQVRRFLLSDEARGEDMALYQRALALRNTGMSANPARG